MWVDVWDVAIVAVVGLLVDRSTRNVARRCWSACRVRCWEVFHVKQQGEYVWVDDTVRGGEMLPSWLGDSVMVGRSIREDA